MYVRVVGTEWVADPERRFAATLDVRKAALLAFRQIAAAIEDDLPKGFYLPPDSHQSLQEPLVPRKAFREALANAIVHRSYRFNQPTIVVRYSDRIEFINTGHSLKPVSELGRTGPAQRNPILASVFRDVEIAEAKGSGIRTIRRVCKEHGCPAPEFISNRQAGTFTTILWLPVIEGQSTEVAKPETPGTGKQGQPLPGDKVATLPPELATLVASITAYGDAANPPMHGAKSPQELVGMLEELLGRIHTAGKKPRKAVLRGLLLELCALRPFSAAELCQILGRSDARELTRDHLKPMREAGQLALRYPDKEKHPHQAYLVPKDRENEHG